MIHNRVYFCFNPGLILVARHMSERYSRSRILLAATTILAVALGTDLGFTSLITKLLLDLPNSRAQELEGALSYTMVVLRIRPATCSQPSHLRRHCER
jgi:metalloendopeptidase OMA1, mitochondrial